MRLLCRVFERSSSHILQSISGSGRGVTHCGVWRLCSVDLWCVRVLSLRVLRVVRRALRLDCSRLGAGRRGELNACVCHGNRYGVRPCSVHTFGDQLGLVPGTKSKIEDGSATGTFVTLGAAVARIFDSGNGSSPSWSPVFRIPHGRRRRRQPPCNKLWSAFFVTAVTAPMVTRAPRGIQPGSLRDGPRASPKPLRYASLTYNHAEIQGPEVGPHGGFVVEPEVRNGGRAKAPSRHSAATVGRSSRHPPLHSRHQVRRRPSGWPGCGYRPAQPPKVSSRLPKGLLRRPQHGLVHGEVLNGVDEELEPGELVYARRRWWLGRKQ